MVTLKTVVNVKGITSKDIYQYMLDLDDEKYQKWWHGTHLVCHTVKKYPGDIGNIVYADEYVGKYRLKGHMVITKLVPFNEMVFQFKKGIRLPARFIMKFEDHKDGINLTHIIEAGGNGFWRIFDPLIRLFLSDEFERNLNAHAQEEFPMLAEMLSKK